MAACGPTETACGLFPVAFPLDQWDDMRDACGVTFYVWAGDQDDRDHGGQQPNCEPYNATTNPDACDCDLDPSSPGIEVIAENGRAWVDFTSSINYDEFEDLYPDACGQSNGCGTSELKCWIENDAPTPFSIPQWISGSNGVRAGTQNEIRDRAARPYPGNVISVPIFDDFTEDTFEDCQKSYHIVELGCATLEGWDNSVQLDYADGRSGGGHCWNGSLSRSPFRASSVARNVVVLRVARPYPAA